MSRKTKVELRSRERGRPPNPATTEIGSESFLGKRADGLTGKKSVFSSPIVATGKPGERGPLALPALGAEPQIARLPLLCRGDEVLRRIDPGA
jgi:hypothetical protein